jgi:hypothetical protein
MLAAEQVVPVELQVVYRLELVELVEVDQEVM